MKREPFNIKFKDKILSGNARVLFKNNIHTRIICWDRRGVKNSAGEDVPIVALIDTPHDGEILMESTINGHVYSIQDGSHQGLYIEYDPIGISKVTRVGYSLLNCPYIEKYMRKYGYEEKEEKGHYWNSVEFANKYAKSHTKELHDDLKANGDWEYDDDYDWD